jgi:hypothetical protein
MEPSKGVRGGARTKSVGTKLTGNRKPGRPCAGINRHVVGNERVLQERNSEPPGLESCGVRREARVEA